MRNQIVRGGRTRDVKEAGGVILEGRVVGWVDILCILGDVAMSQLSRRAYGQ